MEPASLISRAFHENSARADADHVLRLQRKTPLSIDKSRETERERERERERDTRHFRRGVSYGWEGGGRSDNTVEIAGSSERRGWRLRMLVVAGAAGGEAASQVFANVARSSRGMGVCYGLR